MGFGTVNVGGGGGKPSGSYVSTDRVGIPGGIATLNGNGKLTDSQLPAIDKYTRQESDENLAQAITQHNESLDAHADIRAEVDSVRVMAKAIELKFTDITENPFTVGFSDLDGVTVTGVYNEPQARIEF